MKPVVILAYHFPPLGGVAVMRWLRFCRYLPERGFRPVLVCVAGGGQEPRDYRLLEEIPQEVEVHRVACFEPDNYCDSWEDPAQKVIRNLFKTFDFTLFPDDRAWWIEPAAAKAVELVKHHQAEVVVATAQPWSTLVAGMRVQQQTGARLVLDFRDDWTTSNRDFRRRKPNRQSREVELEAQVLKAASAAITVTPGIVEALRQRAPRNLPINYLPNGFDPAHFEERPDQTDDFTIVHAGGLYPKRDPAVFLEGWARFRQRHPEVSTRLILAGKVDPAIAPQLDREGIECPGFLPHHQVRNLLMQARVQLLLLEQVTTVNWLFTGKVFEYVGAGRPILMVGPPGSPLAQMVEATGNSVVCPPDSPEAVAEGLAFLHQHQQAPDPATRERYNARIQTAQLIEWLG